MMTIVAMMLSVKHRSVDQPPRVAATIEDGAEHKTANEDCRQSHPSASRGDHRASYRWAVGPCVKRVRTVLLLRLLVFWFFILGLLVLRLLIFWLCFILFVLLISILE